MRVYTDTNILVSSIVATHSHHAAGKALVDSIGAGKHKGFISAHGLTEIYSVLTRTPFSPRFSPSEVWQILSDDLLPVYELVTLTSSDYRDIVQKCSNLGFSGGRVHDLAHIHAAKKAGCDKIYTFDVRAFQALAPELSKRIAPPD